MELSRDRNASEAVVLDEDLCLLSPPILEGNIDGSCGDEVVPTGQCVITMPKEGEHEHHGTYKVRHFKKLITKGSGWYISCITQPQSINSMTYRIVLWDMKVSHAWKMMATMPVQ